MSGYAFNHWTVGGASWDQGANPITFTVDASYEAIAHYTRAQAWWDIAFSPDNLKLILAVLGVMLTSASITAAWVRTRKRRSTMNIMLEEIDQIFSKLKTNPKKCAEELQKYENKVLKKLTEGRITEPEHRVLEKKMDKCMKELQKKKER
jgi:hypothetical protein